MQTHHIDVTGTFAGHVFPGSLLVVWALLWTWEAFRLPEPGAGAPLERTRTVPALKVVLPLAGAWLELPNRGWLPQDALMAWQHIAMYVGFALGGVVDLLVRRGRLSHRVGYVAYALAMLNAGLLFSGHGNHGGVPGVAHTLLAVLFYASAAAAIAEPILADRGVAWLRRTTLLALGSWLIVIAHVLYRSGWDMADPVREGWTYLLFSATAIACCVLMTAARLLAGPRSLPSPSVPGPRSAP